MLLESICEFRGKEIRKNEKGSYYYVNLEDETGNACKFPAEKFSSFEDLKKGDKVKAFIDYNVKYGSLKVINCEKVGFINGK